MGRQLGTAQGIRRRRRLLWVRRFASAVTLRHDGDGSKVRPLDGLPDIVNGSVPKGDKKFVRRRAACRVAKKNWSTRATRASSFDDLSRRTTTSRPPTHWVSSSSRRGCFVVRSTSVRCPSCLRSNGPPIRPRLRRHGRLTHRRKKSDWLPTRRHRYR